MQKNKENFSRRDLLKVLGVSSVSLGGIGLTMPTKAQSKSDKSPTIAIIGAGLGGISLSAKLVSELPNAKIKLFDAEEILYYQPGFTLIAAGLYSKQDTQYNKKDLINDKVEWIKENVSAVEPNANRLTTTSGQVYVYDYLVSRRGRIFLL